MEGTPGDWVSSWDMDEQQTLPKAIRLTVGIRKKRFGSSMANQLTLSGNEQLPVIIYQLVVLLPITIEKPPESDSAEPQL